MPVHALIECGRPAGRVTITIAATTAPIAFDWWLLWRWRGDRREQRREGSKHDAGCSREIDDQEQRERGREHDLRARRARVAGDMLLALQSSFILDPPDNGDVLFGRMSSRGQTEERRRSTVTPTPLSGCDGSASDPDAGGRDRLG
jgi:hypothetical protein